MFDPSNLLNLLHDETQDFTTALAVSEQQLPLPHAFPGGY